MRPIIGGVQQSVPVDGFRLGYERAGQGRGVLLLHGWPGDRTDYRDVVPLVSAAADVVVPDLRGFGQSDKHRADPASQYTAAAQARGIAGLITELGLDRPVIAGYDIGSRIAQAVARERPDLVSALVVSPPLPGIGDRILRPGRSGSSGISRSISSPCAPTSSTAARTPSALTCVISGRTGPGRPLT